MTDTPTSAVDLAADIRSGACSPREAVQACIDRIQAHDGAINAVIHQRFDQALAEADDPDLPDGPFRGVPMLIKDLWPASAGDPMHCGSAGLLAAGHIGAADANIVRQYRNAGFVIVGRTNTPELGLAATTEPLSHGPTRNPWDTNRGSGGSSGGAAAAVAAGYLPAANASDGGGSIRIPAAMCGLVGLKPSRGRISMGPEQDEWGHSIQHVVCNTVEDAAAILDITVGAYPGDGVIAPDIGWPYADRVLDTPDRLRIGIVDHARRFDVHEDCRAATRRCADLLAELGHEVVEGGPAAFDTDEASRAAFGALNAVGVAGNFAKFEQWLGRPVQETDVEPATWRIAQRGDTMTAADVGRAQGEIHRWRRDMAAWWADGFDLLLTPTTAYPAPTIGDLVPTDDDPMRGAVGSSPYATFTSPFNATGQPAISLPMGLSDGVPVGVQLVADYAREDLLVRIAGQIERAGAFIDRCPMATA